MYLDTGVSPRPVVVLVLDSEAGKPSTSYLQFTLQLFFFLLGDPFAGVIRELWQDIPGYKIMDLTSNPNFPNNPSSIEVLDKFDAPHNVDDNYGSRIRGFFKAPESGLYRYIFALLVILKKNREIREPRLKYALNLNTRNFIPI